MPVESVPAPVAIEQLSNELADAQELPGEPSIPRDIDDEEVPMQGGLVPADPPPQAAGDDFLDEATGRDAPPPDPRGRPLPQVDPLLAQAPLSARRILVVDDNEDAASTLAVLLRIAGNEVQTAYDGAAAIAAAQSSPFDVIMLDIGMPKMNGFAVCRALRAEPWGSGVVIVALTGWGQDEDRRKSKEAGFDGHLVKPVDYADLMKLLADCDAAR